MDLDQINPSWENLVDKQKKQKLASQVANKSGSLPRICRARLNPLPPAIRWIYRTRMGSDACVTESMGATNLPVWWGDRPENSSWRKFAAFVRPNVA